MNLEAEQGVEQLWKYQLRREHAALLEAVDAQNVSVRQIEERVNALDTRMSKVLSDHAQLTRDVQSRINDLADFRKAEKSIKSELQALAERVGGLENKTVKSQENPCTLSSKTFSSHKYVNNYILVLAVADELLATAPEAPSSSVTPQDVAQPPSTTAIKKGPRHVANTGPRRSKRLLRDEDCSSTADPPAYSKLPDPPLTQDGRPIEVFVNCFDYVSVTIAPHDQKLLAAMFVTGLDERKLQDIIVSALEKKKMAKVHENKKVEIRCVWDDVKKELERCGMLATEGRAVEKKKRKM
jgi:hypothetical protein